MNGANCTNGAVADSFTADHCIVPLKLSNNQSANDNTSAHGPNELELEHMALMNFMMVVNGKNVIKKLAVIGWAGGVTDDSFWSVIYLVDCAMS